MNQPRSEGGKCSDRMRLLLDKSTTILGCLGNMTQVMDSPCPFLPGTGIVNLSLKLGQAYLEDSLMR